MDLNQVRQELEQGKAVLVDVREQEEWDKDHLKHATLHPLSRLNEGDIPQNLPKDKMIYTHCRKGGRAQQAAQILQDYYPEVQPLKFEFEELKKQGL